VIVRGIECKAIFRDDADRNHFVVRLGHIVAASQPCFAWALMTNHVHQLVRTGMWPHCSTWNPAGHDRWALP
jgi:putative transposase